MKQAITRRLLIELNLLLSKDTLMLNSVWGRCIVMVMESQKMTPRAIELRRAYLAEAVKRHGRKKIEQWADDPIKVGIINAMMQIQADGEGGRK